MQLVLGVVKEITKDISLVFGRILLLYKIGLHNYAVLHTLAVNNMSYLHMRMWEWTWYTAIRQTKLTEQFITPVLIEESTWKMQRNIHFTENCIYVHHKNDDT